MLPLRSRVRTHSNSDGSSCGQKTNGQCFLGACTTIQLIVGVFGGHFSVVSKNITVFVNGSVVEVPLLRSGAAATASASSTTLQVTMTAHSIANVSNFAVFEVTWQPGQTTAVLAIPYDFDPVIQATSQPGVFQVSITDVQNGDVDVNNSVTTVTVMPLPGTTALAVPCRDLAPPWCD